MTIDKSLRIKAGGVKQRNVLTRTERLAKLKELDRWSEGDKVIGLPKVRVQKIAMKKKKKAKGPEGEEGDAAAAPAAAAAKPAAAAKAPAKK
jgi:small basic protein (TIGR04137 family)